MQKGETISKEEIKFLRKLGIIEGKATNLYVSAKIAEMVDEKAKYIQNKGFDDEHYKKLIISYLKKFGSAKKKDFIELLFNKLPDVLDEKQKYNKIRNLLTALKKQNIIDTDSENQRIANWILVKKGS